MCLSTGPCFFSCRVGVCSHTRRATEMIYCRMLTVSVTQPLINPAPICLHAFGVRSEIANVLLLCKVTSIRINYAANPLILQRCYPNTLADLLIYRFKISSCLLFC